MDLSLQPLESGLLASLTGRLDHAGATTLRERLQHLLDCAGDALVIDLAGLEAVSSEGLRVLVTLGQKARAAGTPLAFSGLAGLVRETFDISGLLQVLVVAPTPLQAYQQARHG